MKRVWEAGRQRAFLRPATVWLLELGVRWLWRGMHMLLRDWRAWAYHVATLVHCPREWLLVTEAPGIPRPETLLFPAGIRTKAIKMEPSAAWRETVWLLVAAQVGKVLMMSLGLPKVRQFQDEGPTTTTNG